MTDLTKLYVSGVHAWAYGKGLHPSEVWEKAFNELVRRLEEAEKRDQFNCTERLRLEQANKPSEVSEEDKRVSYEIYAPEFGAIHSDVVVSKADTLEEAEKKFKTACEKWLYVRLVEVTKRTIKREYPNKR